MLFRSFGLDAVGNRTNHSRVAGDWVLALEDPSIYLSPKLLAQAKADPAIAEDIAGRAVLDACTRLRSRIVAAAAALTGESPARCTLHPDGVACGTRFVGFGEIPGLASLTATGRHDGTPRSVAFNVQAFRVAVDTATGVVRVLRSVQAADASKEAADKSWKAFREDPEWIKVRAESEKDGKFLAKPPESVYMNPTDYSPLK